MTEPTGGDRAVGRLARRIAAAHAALGDLRPAVRAGEPWPLARSFGTEPEADWGPREVLTHVAEMLPFWLGELERVVAADGFEATFGRTSDDALRIGVLERDRTLPLRALDDRIDLGVEAWLRRLADLDEGSLDLVGLHPRLGQVTAAGIVDRFVASHLEEHAEQLARRVGAR